MPFRGLQTIFNLQTHEFTFANISAIGNRFSIIENQVGAKLDGIGLRRIGDILIARAC